MEPQCFQFRVIFLLSLFFSLWVKQKLQMQKENNDGIIHSPSVCLTSLQLKFQLNQMGEGFVHAAPCHVLLSPTSLFSVTTDTGAKSMTHARLQDRPGSLPPTLGLYMEMSGRKAKKSCEMPQRTRQRPSAQARC